MGALVSTGVHFGTETGCLAAQVTGDNPPDYDTLDLRVSTPGLAFQDAFGVGHDPLLAAEPATAGMWHYPGECPAR